MNLMHYASEPVVFDRSRRYGQNEPSTFGKPEGFWVSVEGEDDWPSWCRAEGFNLGSLRFAHRVTLAASSNVLRIFTADGLDAFTDRFGALEPRDRKYATFDLRGIDWRRVADHYGGIVVAPYQYSRRLSLHWYYGWDAASGCVWNPDAVEAVELVESAAVIS